MLFPLFRTSAVGNFGSCQCPVWLTARCELKDVGRNAGGNPGIPSGPAEQPGLTASVSTTRSGLGELKGRGWAWAWGMGRGAEAPAEARGLVKGDRSACVA